MAGIGFEIRKILKEDSYLALLKAYGYAGVIGSGPWALSILAMLLIGILGVGMVVPNQQVAQFQVSITHLMLGSLCLSGFLQLAFTRYIADRLFEKRDKMVLPSFHGALLVVTLAAGIGGWLFLVLSGSDLSLAYRLLMGVNFVVLNQIWIATIFLSGMKCYKQIVRLYALGYALSVGCSLGLHKLGLEGLLGGFLIGQFVLLAGMMIFIMRTYPSDHFISFDFLRRGRMYRSLIWTGFFYNLGVWIDKLIFWYLPSLGQQVIGPLHASVLYDVPIFLAYLSIIPGMAVFLVRMETDFVEFYAKFYDAVRDGGTLQYIEDMRDELVRTARQGNFEIMKVQTIAVLVGFVAGPALLRVLGISELYVNLLYVDSVAAGLQVVLLGILNVYFYLDKRFATICLCAGFTVLNAALTLVSIAMGPVFYGYGFAVAMLLSVLIGMTILDRRLDRLEYETFMLR
ncbi:MAG: exopolysaccharide Pel transporter PelG [Gammaproteobacteria bacterium]